MAFEATGDAARAWLNQSSGIHGFGLVDIPSPSSRVPLQQEIISRLGDRSDGTVLLATALAHSQPTGEFRDLFRVFERAFALPARQVIKPLETFLDERYGYTTAELEGWGQARDEATHADVRKRFVLEADVRPVLARVRQAAYDVVFNKERWRDPGSERRQVWAPTGWTCNASHDMQVQQRSAGRMEALILDQFGAYPIDLGEHAPTPLPEEWWTPDATSLDTPQRPLEVVPTKEPAPDSPDAM